MDISRIIFGMQGCLASAMRKATKTLKMFLGKSILNQKHSLQGRRYKEKTCTGAQEMFLSRERKQGLFRNWSFGAFRAGASQPIHAKLTYVSYVSSWWFNLGFLGIRHFNLAPFVGACAMTTKFLDNKICDFKILLSWRCPRKKQRFGRFSSLPPRPPPLENRKFYFYCRLAVSDLSNLTESIEISFCQIDG